MGVDLRAAPAVLPALGVLAGAAAGLRLAWLPVPLALALLAAAIALGGRGGRLIAGLAAGLLAAAIGTGPPDAGWPGIDPARPVAVEGKSVTPWRRLEWGWRGELAVERLAQGRTVVAGPRRLAIELPDDVRPPARGSRLRARGYLGRPAGYANRIAVPPGPWRLRVKSLRLLEVQAAPGRIDRAADALRLRVEEAMEVGQAAARDSAGHLPGRGAALARALVLGEPDDLPPRWRRGLRRSGLAHLLAVSGLHAGLVAGVAMLVAAPLPRPVRIVVALVAVAGYLAVVGPRPSMLRASGMVLIAGIGVITRRGPATGNALAVVAAALALARPELTADVGFQLTVSATAGIVFLAPRLDAAWQGAGEGGHWPRFAGREDEATARAPRRGDRAAARRLLDTAVRWLRLGLAATAGAQLASLPLALPVFHLGSWVAPALNLAAVPYTAFALAACLGWTAFALAAPETAGAALPLLDRVAAPFGWPALGPPGAWGTAASVAPAAACWALAALAAAWLLRPRRRAWLAPAAVLAALVCWRGLPRPGAPGAPPRAAAEAVSLTLLDVGQGDAILLRSGGRSLLVDGGGWRHGDFGGRVLLPALLGEGVHRLDAVALTHPDADHCHGLADVASYLPIGQVWLAPHWTGDPCAEELAATPGARAVYLGAGGARNLGDWRIEVLGPEWPASPVGAAAAADPNRFSLVLRAEAHGRCVLLTGDLDQAGERAVLRRLPDPRCELLKVGHHGSKTSTGRALLAALGPRAALISAGRDNPYGHPAGEVVERLERAGVTLLRTDRLGLVRIEWAPGSPLSIEVPAAPP
jgi:competence protein ComEC